MGDGWGIYADYAARCEPEAGDPLLGIVTGVVKYFVNTESIQSLCVCTQFICTSVYFLDAL